VQEQPETDMLYPMLSTLQTLLTTTETPALLVTDVVAPMNTLPDKPGTDILYPMLSTLQTLLTTTEKPAVPITAVIPPPPCPEPAVAPPPCAATVVSPEPGVSPETVVSKETVGTNAHEGSIENNEAIIMRKPRARPGQKPADAIEVANIQLDGPENTKTIWLDTKNNEIYNNDAPVKGAGRSSV
jgi:hypothetical protein